MSSLWNKAKNAVKITKLQGEIALHQREITARKGRFGTELYDLLTAEKGAFVVRTPGIFHACEEKIKGPFERCKDDLESLQVTKNSHLQEMDTIQVNRDRALPAFTAQEKLNQAGQWAANTANEGKLQAQIALLDRQMKQRKQAFGVEVFDDMEYAKPPPSGVGAGFKAAVSEQFSKFSQKEKEIEECVEQAKKDVAFIQRRIEFKQTQIVELGGTVKAEF